LTVAPISSIALVPTVATDNRNSVGRADSGLRCRRPEANKLEIDPDDFDGDLRSTRHGLGKPRKVGVSASVRLEVPLEGSERTTSGS
jgi:hypothetical protein